MALLVGLIDVPRFLFLVIPELLFERENAYGLSGRIQQGHVFALFELACFLSRYGQGDGKGPQRTGRETHPVNYAFVIPLSHEAFERAASAHGQELEIRERAGIESDRLYLSSTG